MFGYTQAVEFHGIGRTGIGNSCITYQLFIYATDALQLIHVLRQYFLFKFFVAFRTLCYEVLVFHALADDVVQHHIEHSHVSAGAQL
jgi:hypothetical protein